MRAPLFFQYVIFIINEIERRRTHEGFGAALKDGLYGYVSPSCEETVPCVWDFAAPFGEGLVPVRKNDALQVIDTSGAVIRTIPLNCEEL